MNNLIIIIYKITHNVANFIDNEKKEIYKILKNFCDEYLVFEQLKIAFFLFLIFWIIFQTYYGASRSHISYDDYLQIKYATENICHTNTVLEETLKIQHIKMKEMAETITEYRRTSNFVSPGTSIILITLGVCIGGMLVTGAIGFSEIFSS